MGCDIHWTLEIKHGSKWIGVLTSYSKCKAKERWYAFFTELGLKHRGESDTAAEVRPWPEDLSDLAKMHIDASCYDHSHSWLPLEEFVAAYNRAVAKYSSVNPNDKLVTAETLFDTWLGCFEDNSEKRVIFAFDN